MEWLKSVKSGWTSLLQRKRRPIRGHSVWFDTNAIMHAKPLKDRDWPQELDSSPA